jgi:hypothetical protein
MATEKNNETKQEELMGEAQLLNSTERNYLLFMCAKRVVMEGYSPDAAIQLFGLEHSIVGTQLREWIRQQEAGCGECPNCCGDDPDGG